jgi:hypothetical protein
MNQAGNDQDGTWLTYAEAGQRFGISAEAARHIARRRGWPRRPANEPNSAARVFVPDNTSIRVKSRIRRAVNPVEHPANEPLSDGDNRPADEAGRACALAITTLSAQLERTEARAERFERAFNDAMAAERIAANDAAALRAREDARQAWSFVRRLFWAIRPRHS